MNLTRVLPRHIGIIMDGNGRWAQQRGLPRVQGHQEGARSVKDVVRAAREFGITTLTLFAFSEQNWARPHAEVEALMDLLLRYIVEEHDEIMDNGIRLTAVGDLTRLPERVRTPLAALVAESAENDKMVLCLALSYGGREDIVSAARSLAQDVRSGRLDPQDINEALVQGRLLTSELPALDLLIRTSGELRISNFMLWHVAYAELYFTETMWPDFRRAQLEQAISAYVERERRFGMTSEQAALRNEACS